MESNRTHHLLFKYGFLGAGLLIMTVPIISYVVPDSVELNGETGPADPVTAIIMGLVGLILVLVFLAIKHKFAVVKLGNQMVTIKNNGQERTVNWLDIESVSQIQFIFPPLYTLKTKDRDETIWFNTESKYVAVGGYVSDMSDMGALIKTKKRELGL